MNTVVLLRRAFLVSCFLTAALNSLFAAADLQFYKVPMRDGVFLSTAVALPDPEGAFPVILARTPYSKASLTGVAPQAVAKGYVLVAQDTRGRFASEGENLPFDRDLEDGEDTIRWVARQSWCNGKIGTWGGSAVAITQYQLAASGTDLLTCQHMTVGTANLYQGIYSGGIFRKALIEDWLKGSQFAPEALKRWTDHPRYDEYWKARDVSRRYAKINAPAIHIGGYWDIFAQETIDAFNGYQNQGGPGARGNQKLLLGPWTHGVLSETAGELKFPKANQPPGQVHDAWRWYDHWLKGQDNGIDRRPAVTYYVIGDVQDADAPGNYWRTAQTWPPFTNPPTAFFLHGDGVLSTNPPLENAKSLLYSYNPDNPTPTVGGPELSIPAGPREQSVVEARPDVLVFSSAPLEKPIEVTGRVTARLWITSDAPDTDFFARLCDVYPDGRSFNVCEGRLRARFRQGLEKPVLMEPGKIYPLELDLWSTSIIFNRGHRLRVQVTSSSAPGFDSNPNTGESFRGSDRRQVAQNRVYLEAAHPSQLQLPLQAAVDHLER